MVRAEVNRQSHEYQEGDALSVRVISEEQAYLYVFYQQADGKVFQIFPNRTQPRNRVEAKRWVAIPAEDDLFRWRIGPPFGKELVKVVAARTPLRVLAGSSSSTDRFSPVSPTSLKGAEDELVKGPANRWSESTTEIVTSERRQGPPREGKRFGVFVGIAKYRFNDIIEKVTEGKDHLNLPGCDNDAIEMARLLKTAGKLDQGLLLTNEHATREHVEAAIAGWLPEVSKPGDAVFIFYSSHGGQVPDDYGDEGKGDKMDEILSTYDSASFDVLLAAAMLAKSDKAPMRDDDKRLLALALDAAGPRPDAKDEQAKWAERVDDYVQRQTGISDDLLGHWIQRLDGRQVVIIFDLCHSGGFVRHEKSLVPQNRTPPFRFLDRKFSRLKDIGQRDLALLAACATGESALTRGDVPLGVMTSFLLLEIAKGRRPVELKQAYESCAKRMKEYFASPDFQARNAKRKEPFKPHEPILYDDLSHAAFLVP
jgi:hypothetical protein